MRAVGRMTRGYLTWRKGYSRGIEAQLQYSMECQSVSVFLYLFSVIPPCVFGDCVWQTFTERLKIADPLPTGRSFATLTPLIDPQIVGQKLGEL